MRKLSRAEAKEEFDKAQKALGLSVHFQCLNTMLDILYKSNLQIVSTAREK